MSDGTTQDYTVLFPAPPWPNPNSVQLQPFYRASTTEELAVERVATRHDPLARRGAGGGQDERLAGTYGHPSLRDGHPDDAGAKQAGDSNSGELDGLVAANKSWNQTKDMFDREQLAKVSPPCSLL